MTESKQFVDSAVKAAQSLPDLIARVSSVDPDLAKQLTGKSLLASKSPWGVLITAGLTYASTKYMLGWSDTTVELVSGFALLAGAYLMRLITNSPIKSWFGKAAPMALVFVAAGALPACSSSYEASASPTALVLKADPTPPTPAPAVPTPSLLDRVAAIAIPDLQLASQLAKAQTPPDLVASSCWDGLVPVVQNTQQFLNSLIPSGQPDVLGVFSTFQVARDIKGTLNGAAPVVASFARNVRSQVNLACGALFVDVNASIVDPLGMVSGQ